MSFCQPVRVGDVAFDSLSGLFRFGRPVHGRASEQRLFDGDIAQVLGIDAERIRRQDDEVGDLALFDGADFVLLKACERGPAGVRGKGFVQRDLKKSFQEASKAQADAPIADIAGLGPRLKNIDEDNREIFSGIH